jgi:hypothetical protein
VSSPKESSHRLRMRPLLACLTLVSLLGACSPAGAPQFDGTPDIGVPAGNVNTELRLWAPEELNTFKVNEPISLSVEVTGTEQVVFPRDYGNRMFRNVSGDWVEVENVPTDWGEGSFLLSPSKGDPMAWGSPRVFPWFGDTDSPVLLRVFVVGNRYSDGAASSDKVGAFVDVTLYK